MKSSLFPQKRDIKLSTFELRALFEERKSTIRTVMPEQPSVTEQQLKELGEWNPDLTLGQHITQAVQQPLGVRVGFVEKPFPLGDVGDLLWVQEEYGKEVRHYCGGSGEFLVYRATNPDAVYCVGANGESMPVKWQPAESMPIHYCRFYLKITGVRIERLQEITEEGAIKEGATSGVGVIPHNPGAVSALEYYRYLCETAGINWDANPWVVVTEFERTTLFI